MKSIARMQSYSLRASISVLILIIGLSATHVILGKSLDYRCTHLPPVPNQVPHVWLLDSNFTTEDDASLDDTPKLRRQVRRSEPATDTDNNEVSLWTLFKKLRPSFISPTVVPMKIQVHYDDSVFQLDKAKRDLITKTVMPTVTTFFEGALSLRRGMKIDKFLISRRCPNNTVYYATDLSGYSRPYCMGRCENYAICGEMRVPSAHLSACSYCNQTSGECKTNHSSAGVGVTGAQLLLYVSAEHTARCKSDSTIAYAAHCAQDAKTERPVAGHANLCPSLISTEPKDLHGLIATVKHELTHVLGFSLSLFAYYRDEHGRPLTERQSRVGPLPIDEETGYARWSDRVVKKVMRRDWLTGEGKKDRPVHMVVTPTVVREVRKHFNCSTLEGAELEDQGSDGTSMTHWEKRLFENEAMTGTHTQNSVYSRLTLAVLEDTGWYVANFSYADKLEWGRNLGCDFATKSCKSWISERRARGQSVKPFCDKPKGDYLRLACAEDRQSKAVCNMRQYKEPLAPVHQNFDSLEGVPADKVVHYGGSVDLADYCPFIQEFTWQAMNVSVRGSRCDVAENNPDPERNAALELYGPRARCFEHGRRWEQRSCVYRRQWHHYGAGCYRYECVNGHIAIRVGNATYSCYYPDQTVTVEQLIDDWFYNGTIKCPPCDSICPPNKCKTFRADLVNNILNTMHTYEPLFRQRPGLLKEALSLLDDKTNEIEDPSNHLVINTNSSKYLSRYIASMLTKDIRNKSLEDSSNLKEQIDLVLMSFNTTPRVSLRCSACTKSASPQLHISIALLIIVTSWLMRQSIQELEFERKQLDKTSNMICTTQSSVVCSIDS